MHHTDHETFKIDWKSFFLFIWQWPSDDIDLPRKLHWNEYKDTSKSEIEYVILILKPDLDVIKMYLYSQNEVPSVRFSKVNPKDSHYNTRVIKIDKKD